MKGLWNNCLPLLQRTLNDPRKVSLINSLRAVSPNDNSLLLYPPDRWTYNQIDSELSKVIRSCLNQVGGKDVVVSLESTAINGHAKEQENLTIEKTNISPRFTFDNFIPGASNEMAYEICRDLCEPDSAHLQLLITGGVGLGKTHLMQAVGNKMLKKQTNQRVIYFHSELFTTQCITAMRTRKADDFVARIRKYDCLLIDDFQFFASKTATQELLLHTLDYFLMHEKRFLVVCDKYPKNINNINSRLKSRLCSFLSVNVEPPDETNRIAIIESKLKSLKLKLSETDILYIARNIKSNVRELEGVLKRLSGMSKFGGKQPDSIDVREVLTDIIGAHIHYLSVEKIVECVARYYKLSKHDLVGSKRLKDIAHARHVAIYLSKDMTRESIKDIGKFFNNRDHTTVRHSHSKIEKLLSSHTKLDDDVHQIRNMIAN